jgi:predicted RNase H-like HicB family nuclease
MRYTVVLVPGEQPGRYVAYVPVIPGCVTQGDSIAEALAMAKDAADAMLAVAADHNENTPTEPDGVVIRSIKVVVPELASTAA